LNVEAVRQIGDLDGADEAFFDAALQPFQALPERFEQPASVDLDAPAVFRCRPL
jgi:hypothetical protein